MDTFAPLLSFTSSVCTISRRRHSHPSLLYVIALFSLSVFPNCYYSFPSSHTFSVKYSRPVPALGGETWCVAFGFGRCVSTAPMGSVYLEHRVCCVNSYKTKTIGVFCDLDPPLLIAAICLWGKLDDGVQGNLYVGQVRLRKIMKVGVAASKVICNVRSAKKKKGEGGRYVQTSEYSLSQNV